MTVPFPAQVVEGHDNQLNWEALGLILSSGTLPVVQSIAGKFQAQYGVVTIAVPANSATGYNVPLGMAWPTSHLFFLALAAPQSSFTGVSNMGSFVVSLTNGGINIANGATPQNFNVSYLSLGN